MKKIISMTLALLILVGMAVPAFALERNQTAEITSSEKYMLTNGDYCIVTVTETVENSRAVSFYKSGSKTYKYYTSSDVLVWTFTVNGEFTVNQGVSAKCIGTSYTYSIKNSDWSLSSASTHGSGNKAYGNATFTMKNNVGVVNNQSCSVTLTCDANGNLS